MSAVAQSAATPAASADGKPAIRIAGLNKWYGEFHVLKNIDLTVARGEKIVVCGPSGSGKSTLIRCINRLEEHQKGSIVVNGIELTDDIKNIDTIRSDVGMVFQHFNLFPHLSVLDNCTLAPMWVRKQSKAQAEATAMKYLERVRIKEQAPKYPGQLSGGQQQRVAIARALANDPALVVCDEPTAALDAHSGQAVMELLDTASHDPTRAVLVVTHDDRIFSVADRIIKMEDGRVIDDGLHLSTLREAH
jgi:general L-amino acid transport system ATP-binding protein